MKKILGLVSVLAIFCISACAQISGETASSTFASIPPYAPLPHYLAFKWDISNKDVPLEREFSVKRYDAYHFDFCLRAIHPVSDKNAIEELQRQKDKFFGNGNVGFYDPKAHTYLPPAITSDQINHGRELVREGKAIWKYAEPGVIIPVHLQIEKLQDNKLVDVTKYEMFNVEGQMINTQGITGGGYGCLFRSIGWAKMRPGDYKITASTNKDIVLPPNTEIYLYLNKPENSRPLENNE